MTAQNAPPSRNPTNNYSAIGAFAVALEKFLQNVDDMLPAKVVAYNRMTNRAQVQPLVSQVTELNDTVPRAQVASVPVMQFGGGGFVLSFPLKPGDLGWIKSNDRDISFFKKLLGFCTPNTARKHSFEDGVFISDTMMKAVIIAAEDTDNAVLQNLAGTVRIALWPNQLKITTPCMAVGDTAAFASNPNAILEAHSTTKAFLYPRMSTGQKNSIPSPVPGMAVFDTTEDGVSVYTAGGGWS